MRRAPGAARVLLPYWVIALALAGAVHLDLLPVRGWLQVLAPPPSALDDGPVPEPPEPLEPAAAPLPALPASAWETPPAEVDEPLPVAIEPEPEAPAEPPERIAEPVAPVAPAAPDPIAALERPAPRTAPPQIRHREPARSREARISSRDYHRPVLEPRRVSASRPAPKPAPPATAKSIAKSRGSAAGGKSCEAALAAYRESLDPSHPPDLSAADYAGVLNNGRYFAHCGVPARMAVQICVAVQNGQAKGVTVRTSPANGAKQRCIARAVWGLSFPSHPRMDVARATFK